MCTDAKEEGCKKRAACIWHAVTLLYKQVAKRIVNIFDLIGGHFFDLEGEKGY